MLKQEVEKIMEKLAPIHLSESWDNVGMLIDVNEKIKGILLCVDVTKEIIFEAKQKGANLIISHHPIIFNGLKNLSCDDVAYHAIKNDISVYSAHTNMDISDKGINFELAKLLDLKEIKLLSSIFEGSVGVIGALEEKLSLQDFCNLVKEKLDTDNLRVSGNSNTEIKKIVVCGGSGADMIPYAQKLDADVVLTSEIKHNYFVDFLYNKICLIDAGHYDTEKHFVNLVKTHLQFELDDVNCNLAVLLSDYDRRPYYNV